MRHRDTGWFFYGGGHDHYERTYMCREPATPGYDLACKLLRGDSIPDGMDRDAFNKWLTQIEGRWAEEGAEALQALEAIPAGTARRPPNNTREMIEDAHRHPPRGATKRSLRSYLRW